MSVLFDATVPIPSPLADVPIYVSWYLERDEVYVNKEDRSILVHPFMAVQLEARNSTHWLELLQAFIVKGIEARAAAATTRIDKMVDKANHEHPIMSELMVHETLEKTRSYEYPDPVGPSGVWVEYPDGQEYAVDTVYIGTVDGIAEFEIVPPIDPLFMKPVRLRADTWPGYTSLVFPMNPSGVELWTAGTESSSNSGG